MAGTISTLGAGSGIDLQGMLEQLREIDQKNVTLKEDKITEFDNQLVEFDVVNNKLFAIKAAALDLSLASNYLERTVSSSDDTVVKADSVLVGATAQSNSLDVTKLATKNSWLSSSGSDSSTSSVYVPTTQQSSEAIADTANYITADDTLTITFGPEATKQTINVSVTTGMSLTDVVNAINNDDENGNAAPASLYVTAEDYVDGSGDHFLRISSTAGGSGESERVMITDQLSDDALAAPDKTLSYQVGSGSTISVSVAADTTLTAFAALINDDVNNPGITAQVINDGDPSSPYRLSLVSDSEGEDGRITFLSQLADMNMTEQQGAAGASLNAQFAVDGINYQRQSNTFSDVITGVSLTLEGAGSSTITVSNNDDQIKTLVKDLVEAYNDAVQEIKTNTAYDSETGKFGVLARTTLQDLPNTLQSLMTATNKADEDGNITSLFDLGLEFNRDGSISIDETMLDTALATYPDGFSSFFVGDSDRNIEGLGDLVNDQMRIYTGAEGQISGEEDSVRSRISDLESVIEKENFRLDKKYELMTKQFIELDTYMNQMTSLSDYLSTTFDSMSNAWSSNKK